MSKVIKQMEMDDLKRTFQSVRDLVVLHIDKLSCQADHALRASLRKKNIRLKMVKNSLTRKVFQDLNIAVPDDSPIWQKSTVLAYGGEERAKVATRFVGPTSSQPLALSADDSRLVVANPDNDTVTVFHTVGGQLRRLAEVAVGDEPSGVAILPDGSKAFVANTVSGTITVLRITPNQAPPVRSLGTIKVGTEPYGLALVEQQVEPTARRAKPTHHGGGLFGSKPRGHPPEAEFTGFQQQFTGERPIATNQELPSQARDLLELFHRIPPGMRDPGAARKKR